MQPRKTVRVLLLNPADRLLLIRMHDPNVGDASGRVLRHAYWVTKGGECEPGEDIAATAMRELAEEPGFQVSVSVSRYVPPGISFACMARTG